MKKLGFLLILFSFQSFAREMILVHIYAETVEQRTEVANYIHIDHVELKGEKKYVEAHVNTQELQEIRKNISYKIEVKQVLYTGTQEYLAYLTSEKLEDPTKPKVFIIKRKLMVSKRKDLTAPLNDLLDGFDIVNDNLKISQVPDKFESASIEDSTLHLNPGDSFQKGILILRGKSTDPVQDFEVQIELTAF
ncbi:MAG: hypothetical protein H6621_03345 [Halobacteriovoraceae bacterium]|nr:hypothetical protein [Halobacteriovoraceae bacterium]MCB9094082.1 hypothetical protein [Halobacteriovoraceae bacterium]